MSFEFRDQDHTYWLDGKRLPSVSEILTPVVDLSAIPDHVLERKTAIGKAVHLACQIIDEGSDFGEALDPLLVPYVQAYRKFLAEHQPQWSMLEQACVNTELAYAGTPDRFGCIGRIGGTDEWLIDLKTVAKVSPATGLQTAGYASLIGKKGCRRAALQLRPDGSYRLEEFKNPMDYAVFSSLLTLQHWKAKHASH